MQAWPRHQTWHSVLHSAVARWLSSSPVCVIKKAPTPRTLAHSILCADCSALAKRDIHHSTPTQLPRSNKTLLNCRTTMINSKVVVRASKPMFEGSLDFPHFSHKRRPPRWKCERAIIGKATKLAQSEPTGCGLTPAASAS